MQIISRFLIMSMASPPDKGDGIPQIIKTNPPNCDIAWTWEGRVEKEKMNLGSQVKAFFCSVEKKIHIARSIINLPHFNLREKENVIRGLNSLTIWCDISESPVLAASKHIIDQGI